MKWLAESKELAGVGRMSPNQEFLVDSVLSEQLTRQGLAEIVKEKKERKGGNN